MSPTHQPLEQQGGHAENSRWLWDSWKMACVLRETAKFAAEVVIVLGWVAATFTFVITAQLMTVDEEWEGWDFGLVMIFIVPWLALSGAGAAGLWLLFRWRLPS